MLRKLIVYCISFIVLTLFASPAFAQASTPSSTSKESKPTFEVSQTTIPEVSKLPTTVSPTSPLYTDLLVHNIFHTFSCLAIGQSVIGQPCLNYVKGVPVLSQANLSGGALGATTSMIGMLFANPPVRTSEYLASVGTNLGIVKEAHAQVGGTGASVLSPIITLWQVSRNIAYVLMIVIFVVIGLMIVFRQKINPQTVITAQAALPGLVIGLVLITFSYFLAGLISDTAFVGTNIVGYYFAAAQNKTNDTDRLNLAEQISPYSVIGIFSKFLGLVSQAETSSAVDSIWGQIDDEGAKNWLRIIAGFIASQQANHFTSLAKIIPGVGEGVQAVANLLVGIVAGALPPSASLGFGLSFVAFLILLYSMFRLLLRLITSFLTIIFLTISAPFQFLFSSLPGRQGIATEWILNMLGNVLVFPVVIAIFYFVAFIQNQDIGPLKGQAQLNPMNNNTVVSEVYAQGQTGQTFIVGSATFPLFGGIDKGFIRILLAFGALIALPSLPDIVVKTVGKASQAGEIIGREIGSGVGQGQRYSGQMQQGIGSATGAAGQGGRRLFDTESYYVSGFDADGKPEYKLNPYNSHVGAIHKPAAKAAFKNQVGSNTPS